MLLTEYNEVEKMELFKEEGRQEGRIEGRQEGRIEGEDLLGKLVSILLSKGMVTEASRAASDKSVRQQLYKEYGLI